MMYRNTDKEIYNIYKRIMYDTGSRAVAEEYTKTLDALQEVSQSFSQAQWKAVKDYQNAFMKLHNTMMAIALRKTRK